jgi:hypothetical protein
MWMNKSEIEMIRTELKEREERNPLRIDNESKDNQSSIEAFEDKNKPLNKMSLLKKAKGAGLISVICLSLFFGFFLILYLTSLFDPKVAAGVYEHLRFLLWIVGIGGFCLFIVFLYDIIRIIFLKEDYIRCPFCGNSTKIFKKIQSFLCTKCYKKLIKSNSDTPPLEFHRLCCPYCNKYFGATSSVNTNTCDECNSKIIIKDKQTSLDYSKKIQCPNCQCIVDSDVYYCNNCNIIINPDFVDFKKFYPIEKRLGKRLSWHYLFSHQLLEKLKSEINAEIIGEVFETKKIEICNEYLKKLELILESYEICLDDPDYYEKVISDLKELDYVYSSILIKFYKLGKKFPQTQNYRFQLKDEIFELNCVSMHNKIINKIKLSKNLNFDLWRDNFIKRKEIYSQKSHDWTCPPTSYALITNWDKICDEAKRIRGL